MQHNCAGWFKKDTLTTTRHKFEMLHLEIHLASGNLLNADIFVDGSGLLLNICNFFCYSTLHKPFPTVQTKKI